MIHVEDLRQREVVSKIEDFPFIFDNNFDKDVIKVILRTTKPLHQLWKHFKYIWHHKDGLEDQAFTKKLIKFDNDSRAQVLEDVPESLMLEHMKLLNFIL